MKVDGTVVDEIATLAKQHRLHVGVAESLSSGMLSALLGAGPDASSWFRGAVVAYDIDVKIGLLGVQPGPVVTAACARQMARGAARVLDADAAVATTGVGGPDHQEGEPPGTVFVAAVVQDHERCERFEFAGDADRVLRSTARCAQQLLLEVMRNALAADQRTTATGHSA